jgi:hypothetical protein
MNYNVKNFTLEYKLFTQGNSRNNLIATMMISSLFECTVQIGTSVVFDIIFLNDIQFCGYSCGLSGLLE